jgi:predicted amidohydrolase
MAKYRINIALWQVPTMVVNDHSKPQVAEYERTLTNTMAARSLDERMALLRKRVGKADAFFRTYPGPPDRRNVTLFAAPEYLFARNASEHFVSEEEKDDLLTELAKLSDDFPNVLLFPGTIAWKKPALRPDHPEPARQNNRGQKALVQRELGGTNVYSTRDTKAFKLAQGSGEQYYLARNTCYVMHQGKPLLKYHKRDNGNETDRVSDGEDVFFVHGARDSVFEAEGLSFGLKICAEVATPLPRPVDVQVVISASRSVIPSSMQLRPGAYCCHADAIYPPTVWHRTKGGLFKSGVIEEITADVKRRGGGPITKHRAGVRITHALNHKANAALLDPDAQAYAEKVTEMRGRARYYRLDYDK